MCKLFELPSKVSSCFIFHDESKKVLDSNIWAHAVFFVSEDAYRVLLDKLWTIRDKYKCMDKKFHFADISGSKLCKSDGSLAIKEWVEIAVEALKIKNSKLFNPPLECKLEIIFFDASCDLSSYGGNKKEEKLLRYFETVLRIILKCCAHKFYSNDNKLKIKGIITDGQPWHRPLDKIRILKSLLVTSRDYVEIDENAFIESVISDHVSNKCNDKDKAQILQLVDLMLGSVICSCFRSVKYGSKKEIIIRPIKDVLVKRRKRGRGFKHSSHYNSFVLSKARIERGLWVFEDVLCRDPIYEDNQLLLFDSN